MTKSHKTLSAFLLAAALFLSGCAGQENSSAQGTENISSDSSLSDSSTASADSQDPKSESTIQNNSEESSGIMSDTVPVEFTEEDKEVQKILEGLEAYDVVYSWLSGAGPYMNSDPMSSVYTFLFPEVSYPDSKQDYTAIPDNYSEMGRIIPHTYEGIKEVMLECLTEEFTSRIMSQRVTKGSLTENSDGSFTVALLDDNFRKKGTPKLIEADGVMYRDVGEGFNHNMGGTIALHTVKVVSRTEDTIEFNFLDGYWAMTDENEKCLNDVILYKQEAMTGVLKYERGGWRRDFDKT